LAGYSLDQGIGCEFLPRTDVALRQTIFKTRPGSLLVWGFTGQSGRRTNLTALLYVVPVLKMNGSMPHFSNVYMLCDVWSRGAECLFIETWKN